MIDTNAVLSALFTTDLLSTEEQEKITPYCSIACEQLSQRLKNEEYAEKAAVILACAGITLYNYLLANSTGEDFLSFKAGDITVRQNREARIESASKFKAEALASAAPYLTDIDFVFEAVEI